MQIVRAYLRASTKEQNANRAKQQLQDFAAQHNLTITTFYAENASGATLNRPELMRLLSESSEGDILLVEQIDRLARLSNEDWDKLKRIINDKKLKIVSPELPTSHVLLEKEASFTSVVLHAVNNLLLDLLAATARKDYEDRRRRQAQGIQTAKQQGKYAGRKEDLSKQTAIKSMLKDKHSYNEIIESVGCSRSLVAKVSKQLKEEAA
ncbi:recombinase family protein [Marinobacterium weihaiense]|uniref:Recombinase family protein n=1 Tax=Marinobacterium weihaiense TaxID=2851016 RepID=A0ABS6MF06_9GAMM|nr:recombinase family protein [Marinobacterium weihaiense]MBV0934903.1 recombinase family protein [Marinobacterium weihaiense]